jgi:hypothetical protein
MRQHTVSIDILDKSYQVACEPEQEAELKQAANDLDDQMRAIRSTGKVIGLRARGHHGSAESESSGARNEVWRATRRPLGRTAKNHH